MRKYVTCLLALGLAAATTRPAQSTVVFSTDFESGLPAEMSAPGAQIESVQGGYIGLGPAGNQFGGNLLRYQALTINETSLTLTGLPAHTAVDISFLLAVIDSWDGTELLQIKIDGNTVFSHWFQLATGDATSYIAPTGGLLSSGTQLGWTFSGYHARDRAYNMSVEPAFINIPHTSATLTISWILSATTGSAAQNWQGGSDESWGIDNLRVSVTEAPTGVGATPRGAGALLHPNFPNPFNPSTMIRFETRQDGAQSTLRVFDVRGRAVRTLFSGWSAGAREIRWDGRDEEGKAVPAGVYFYSLSANGQATTRKMVLLR